MTNITAHKNYL